MDRVETPTEELLRGIAKALEREMAENPKQAKRLGFLKASALDCLEAITGTDAS